jgi:TRAP-type C4-dicarboxylate transport system permease small subunit
MSGAKRRALTRWLLAAVLAVFIVASALFAAQGGFGAGHGRYDAAIFALGLPWVLIPWPESSWVSDYAMLVVLPLGFNLLAVLVLRTVFARRR